jgi:hypothetical protein
MDGMSWPSGFTGAPAVRNPAAPAGTHRMDGLQRWPQRAAGSCRQARPGAGEAGRLAAEGLC